MQNPRMNSFLTHKPINIETFALWKLMHLKSDIQYINLFVYFVPISKVLFFTNAPYCSNEIHKRNLKWNWISLLHSITHKILSIGHKFKTYPFYRQISFLALLSYVLSLFWCFISHYVYYTENIIKYKGKQVMNHSTWNE